MEKNILTIIIVTLFIILSLNSIVMGNNIEVANIKNQVISNLDYYHLSEISSFKFFILKEPYVYNNLKRGKLTTNQENILQLLNYPIGSTWPMYCHDTRHTGRSPYSTINNLGIEKWRIRTSGWADGSPVIDDEGTIYIGADELYAINANGTINWKYDIPHKIVHAPAIGEDGILYFGTIEAMPNYLYAIYTSNGSLKWKYNVGDHIWSSPAIGNDGIIYFGDANNYINALYPNGSLKWRYRTNNVVYSSPAIGNDGVIYCGSHDSYLYALFSDGSLKWKYKTGNWIRTSPCIGDDGTIYVVSLDNHLHAVNPNGTMKWKTDVGAGTSPTIGQDGTIYCGYTQLYAIYPNNGSVKWIFDPGSNRYIRGGTPCNSIDGMIYFGTHIGEYDGGEIIAVSPYGTEKWRKMIANDWVDSAPAIGVDGTVYIGSAWSPSDGYLHAFGEVDPDAPSAPIITGKTSGITGTEYEYKFNSTSPLERDIYYYIEWGDGSKENWFGPFDSGEEVKVSHLWSEQGTYTINARAKDSENLWGPWGELQVTMPRNKMMSSSFIPRFLERYPLIQFILQRFSLK